MKKLKLIWKFAMLMLLIPFAWMLKLILELALALFGLLINFKWRWEHLDAFKDPMTEWKGAIRWFKQEWEDGKQG